MKCFFVLSLGRSGTQLFANLLNRDTRAVVHHEPYRWDAQLFSLRAAGGFGEVLDGLLADRFVDLTGRAGDVDIYGEVNSYLRLETEWLRDNLAAQILYLARDGRDFVTSAYGRTAYTAWEMQLPIVPSDGDPAAREWRKMDRFERLCWYWAHTNQMLLSEGNVMQMEKLISDWNYFREGLLEPTGVAVSETDWRRAVARPKNTSLEYRVKARVRRLTGRSGPAVRKPLGRWTTWSDEQLSAFWKICGGTMLELGYSEEG